MRIFSKKAFQFDHPKGAVLAVIVMAGAFSDVEDWVADSAMFKLAQSDGDVEVIGSKADEKAAETGAKAKTKAEKEAEAKAKKEAEDKAKADAEAAAEAEAKAKADADAAAAAQAANQQ